MKKFILIILFLFNLSIYAQGNKAIREISKFQDKINKEFASKEKSPLLDADFESFKSLDFFPIDTAYQVIAQLEFHKDSKPFKMQTTTARLPVYKIYATASFEINGKQYKLNIYQNQKLILTDEFEDHLFLPFTDKTNAISSYGGGRYIDLNQSDKETIIIDFNKAYNPYCAYNDKYSCPIPPKANQLNIEILAGVKAFKH